MIILALVLILLCFITVSLTSDIKHLGGIVLGFWIFVFSGLLGIVWTPSLVVCGLTALATITYTVGIIVWPILKAISWSLRKVFLVDHSYRPSTDKKVKNPWNS